MAGVVLLAAGGTGGHLFPAEALAHELKPRGWRIHLATDDRAGKYGQRFPGRSDPHDPLGDTFGRSPLGRSASGRHLALARGYLQSRGCSGR